MFLNALEHMLRRKLILIAAVLSLFYLFLFWRVVASANMEDFSLESGIPATGADLAYAVLSISGSLLSVMVWGLTIVMGASVLPDEMEAGRMSIWSALPQSRFSVFRATTLAPLCVSVVFGWLLFGATALITSFYAPFTPSSIPLALVSIPLWLSVTWAFVILLSQIAGKIPAILVTFLLEGIAVGLGNLVEVGKHVPELSSTGFYASIRIITFALPFERGYRSLMMGLLPKTSLIEEALAFFGFGGSIPLWEIIYPGVWSAGIFYLAYRVFKARDL